MSVKRAPARWKAKKILADGEIIGFVRIAVLSVLVARSCERRIFVVVHINPASGSVIRLRPYPVFASLSPLTLMCYVIRLI